MSSDPSSPDSASATRDVRLDATGLRVLAHPLRSRLLTMLRTRGPATATGLAAALETNSGATSYHLRRLAEVGLVEDTHHGRGRQRIWRASSHSHSWMPSDVADHPDAQAALDWLDRFYVAAFTERYGRWLDAKGSWPTTWHDGFGISDTALQLTAEELLRLREELHAVIERYRVTAPDAAAGDPTVVRREVAVYTVAFPAQP